MKRFYKTTTLNYKAVLLVVQVIIITITKLNLPPHQVLCGRGQGFGFEAKAKNKTNGWFKRFALPKDTTLNIQPTLSIPVIADTTNFSSAFTSAAEISFPTKIYFDRLGWTTLFDTFTNTNVNIVNQVVSPVSLFHLLGRRRYKRGLKSKPTTIWDTYKYGNTTEKMNSLGNRFDFNSNINADAGPDFDSDADIDHPGGERATLLPSIVKTLDAMGVDGRPCLQRAICEIHEDSLAGYGLLGEILILVFSVSKSRFAKTKHLQDLLEAERLGQRSNCNIYTTRCKTSIFKWHRRD